MASVFSYSSHPMKAEGFHSPACMEALAWGTLRAADRMSAMAYSAADMMLELGALQTTMPRSVAASRSMLSMLTPARPITFNLSAASMTRRVTCVRERTMRPS